MVRFRGKPHSSFERGSRALRQYDGHRASEEIHANSELFITYPLNGNDEDVDDRAKKLGERQAPFSYRCALCDFGHRNGRGPAYEIAGNLFANYGDKGERANASKT